MSREIADLFAEIPKQLTSVERYNSYYTWRQKNFPARPRTYVSTAITSAGYALLADKTQEGWLGDTIKKNTAMNELLLQLLQKQGHFTEELIILPTDIGKVPDWQEIDYMLYWYYTIAGLEPAVAEGIDKNIRSRINPEMGNYQLANEVRRPYYEQLVRLFLEQIEPYLDTSQPIEHFVRLLDPAHSLGGYAEYLLALSLNIPVNNFIITNLPHESFNEARGDILSLKRAGASIPAILPNHFPDHNRPVSLFSQLPLPRVKDIK